MLSIIRFSLPVYEKNHKCFVQWKKKTVSKCNEEIVTRGQNIWDKF